MNAPLLRLIAVLIPLSFGLGVTLVTLRRPFQPAFVAAHGALGLSVLVAIAGVAGPPGVAAPGDLPSAAARLGHLVRLDGVTYVMLILVSFIAVVIVRYSQTYLEGDPGQVRYSRALLATLAAVTVLVLSANLLVIALAWMATSVALHQLLTFYRDRRPAIVAAHKKFLVSRLADACMLGAIVLIGLTVGGLDLDVLNAWAAAHEAMPPTMQLAAVLLVVGVSLKSAQLPFHGWLIQVMEAPTPVSALLHAGVVNIGGFVMIRLAPFMARAPIAQTLLVVIGTITAVVAALVMTTRVSVKVALAWSTCAQMGFMLIECGVGAWHLALLHLVAHSLYKAHAFLSAGTAVNVWRVQSIAESRRPPLALTRMVAGAALVFGAVAASVAAAHALLSRNAAASATLAPFTIVLGLSLSPLVVRTFDGGVRSLLRVVLRGAAVGALYFGGHTVAGHVMSVPQGPARPLAWIVVIAGFLLLFAVEVTLACRPEGRLARVIQPRLFAGLYLDELFTRLTFRIWPPRLHELANVERALRLARTLESR